MGGPLKLGFFGGAGEVTGSRFLLEAGGKRILVDCGLFHGHRRESIEKNLRFQFKPAELDAVVLTHAHIDHSGGLPLLTQRGYQGPIACTAPTVDLCQVMLPDSARLQEEDARFYNKINAKTGHLIEPLYTQDDALKTLRQFRGCDYGVPFTEGDGVQVRLLNAGHVLGSAMVEVEAEGPSGRRKLLFTGDLGRRKAILMETPRPPEGVDTLVIESTYGDRVHDPVAKVEVQLREVVLKAVQEKSKVLIPSFALERTQEIVFILEKLRREGTIPALPVVVDSPMAVNITKIFNKHLGCWSFDDEFSAYVNQKGDPFGFESVQYVRTVEESKALNDQPGPMVILSASGMCEGGRILHHLRNNLDKESTTVLLAGYQAEGTLGRRLQDGAKKVRIFGQEHVVAARIQALHTLSGHADKDDLLAFIGALKPSLRRVFLVHGDPKDRAALAAHLKAAGIENIACPGYGESFDLD